MSNQEVLVVSPAGALVVSPAGAPVVNPAEEPLVSAAEGPVVSRTELPVVSAAEGACCAPLASEPLSPEGAGELTPLFRALADPVRLRLLSLIACHEGGETCVCDLTAAFDLTAPTISYHLKILREAGLIGSQRRGTWVYYWINPGVMARMSAVLVPQPAAGQGAAG